MTWEERSGFGGIGLKRVADVHQLDGDLIVVGYSIKNKVSDVSGVSLNKIVKRRAKPSRKLPAGTQNYIIIPVKIRDKKEGSFSLFFLPSRQLVRERSLHGA